MDRLYVGFKGKGNSSNKIVNSIIGEKLFLTNSFDGLKRDIENISKSYNSIYMFGLDKSLKGTVRIESAATRNNTTLHSALNLNALVEILNNNGIDASIGNNPRKSLCNEAFWYMLEKFKNKAVFFHIPSISYVNENFIKRMKSIL